MAIQLPDILLGFGAWGIGLGVVAGALAGVVGGMGGFDSAADQMDEALDTLKSSTRDFRNELDGLTLGSITEDFGQITPELIQLRGRLVQLRLTEMLIDAGAAVETLATQFDGFGRSAEARLSDLFETAQRWNDDGSQQLAAGFERTLAAVNDLGDAQGISEQRTATAELVEALVAAGFNAQDATEEQREFFRQAIESQNALELAAAAAGVLETNTAAAGSAAATAAGEYEKLAAAALAAREAQAARRAAGAANLSENYQLYLMYQAYGESRMAAPDTPVRHATPSARRGGGGMSDEQRAHNEALREAQRIYDSTRTSAEAYAAEVADLNELLGMGYIDAETHARALDMLAEEYGEASRALDGMSLSAEDIGASFGNILGNARDMNDVLDGMRSLLGDIASQLLSRAFSQLFGGFFPAISLAGARASGGPVGAGKSYLVGEQGPEIFTPGASGGITPNHAIGGGSQVVNIINNSGAQIEQLRSTGPDGTEMLDVMIGKSIASGRQDPSLRRFGAKPVGVKR